MTMRLKLAATVGRRCAEDAFGEVSSHLDLARRLILWPRRPTLGDLLHLREKLQKTDEGEERAFRTAYESRMSSLIGNAVEITRSARRRKRKSCMSWDPVTWLT